MSAAQFATTTTSTTSGSFQNFFGLGVNSSDNVRPVNGRKLSKKNSDFRFPDDKHDHKEGSSASSPDNPAFRGSTQIKSQTIVEGIEFQLENKVSKFKRAESCKNYELDIHVLTQLILSTLMIKRQVGRYLYCHHTLIGNTNQWCTFWYYHKKCVVMRWRTSNWSEFGINKDFSLNFVLSNALWIIGMIDRKDC